MKGRKPIPNEIKLLQGTARADRTHGAEPKPEPTIPDCPSHLNDEAQAEWNRLAPQLCRLKILTALDAAALAAYAVSFSRWADAERHVQDSGAIVRSPAGYPQVSPWLSVANEALRQMKAYAAELGLTPSSRTRLAVATPAQPVSKWAGLLA
jgi:P27 family predicted phage terminase small subunit